MLLPMSDSSKPDHSSDRHQPCDIDDVADWLGIAACELDLQTSNEPIDQFITQIAEMESSYLEFPEDYERTWLIEKLLLAGAHPFPVYVERQDSANFIMEGRHRIVAFHRIGLTKVPVCRVSPKMKQDDRPRS